MAVQVVVQLDDRRPIEFERPGAGRFARGAVPLGIFEQLDGGFQSSLTYTRDGVEQGRTGSGPVMPGFSDRWRGWLRVTTIGEKTTYSLCAEQVFRIGSSPELENLLLYIPADPARKPWTGRP